MADVDPPAWLGGGSGVDPAETDDREPVGSGQLPTGWMDRGSAGPDGAWVRPASDGRSAVGAGATAVAQFLCAVAPPVVFPGSTQLVKMFASEQIRPLFAVFDGSRRRTGESPTESEPSAAGESSANG